MNRPPANEQEIGIQIGLFFWKQKGENYQETAEFIEKLRITDIYDEPNRIVIKTARPGLLIGRKGMNIDGLQNILKKPIHIVESFSWADVMTPIDYRIWECID